jgi:hypothetical protein
LGEHVLSGRRPEVHEVEYSYTLAETPARVYRDDFEVVRGWSNVCLPYELELIQNKIQQRRIVYPPVDWWMLFVR